MFCLSMTISIVDDNQCVCDSALAIPAAGEMNSSQLTILLSSPSLFLVLLLCCFIPYSTLVQYIATVNGSFI